MNKDDLRLLAKHSDLSGKELEQILNELYYPDDAAWLKFFRTLTLALGIVLISLGAFLCLSDIWMEISQDMKLWASAAAFVLSLSLAIGYRKKIFFKNWMWFASSTTFGLFLYLYFSDEGTLRIAPSTYLLYWSSVVFIFSIASRFAVVWLFNILLFSAYILQALDNNLMSRMIILLFWTLVLIGGCLGQIKKIMPISDIFLHTLVLMISVLSIRYVENLPASFLFLTLGVASAMYVLGRKKKALFFLGAASFIAVLNVLNFVFIKFELWEVISSFLFYAIILLLSTTVIIKHLTHLYKVWNHE